MLKRFTISEDNYLREHYLHQTLKQLGQALGRNIGSVHGRLKCLNLVIPEHIKQQRLHETYKNLSIYGGAARYKKGHVPFNKGQKMSDSMYTKCAPTMFKPGNLPHNTKPDGFISIRTDKSGQTYQWIRITKGNWKPLHVHIWEQTYGPIPQGKIVVFKDKNTMNCTANNLECITRHENMLRNTVHRYPADIKQTIQAIGVLTRQINKTL